MDDLIIGLDIGSTKVCAIIAECTDKNTVNVLGVGIAPSGDGIKSGGIVDIERTTRAIIEAISEADKSYPNVVIQSAYVGIAGAHINSINSCGEVDIKGNNQEITVEDIDKAVENAKTLISIPPHQDIIHILPREFVVDEQKEIMNPTGMVGSRLEAHVHIVTGAINAIQNIIKCCEKAEIKVEELVLQPYASSLAVLNEDEKKLGVCLVDIGGGTTDLVIYQNGCVVYSGCINVGGKTITNDLAIVLKASSQLAEKLKIDYGVALRDQADETKMHEIQGPAGESVEPQSERYISEIIEQRLEEIFQDIRKHIEEHIPDPDNMLPAGIVLTGGTSLTKYCAKQASEIFGLPVRIGTPINITGATEKISNPQFSTAIGLIRYGAQKERSSDQTKKSPTGFFAYIKSMLEKFFTN